MPRSPASASTSSDGTVPLLVTSSATPSSTARRWASGRSPTTTTSPSPISPGSDSTAIARTQTRPAMSRSSPATSRPSVTSTMSRSEAAASARLVASRDSRM